MKPSNLYSLFFFKCFLPFVFFSGDGIGVGLTFAQEETHQFSEQQQKQQQKRIILSHPEDIGLGHTRIIDHLQDLLHKHKPKSPKAYLNTLALSLRHNLCNDFSSVDGEENNMDMACHQKMIEIVLKTQPSQREDNLEYIKSILPADFYHHNNEEDDDENNKSLLYYLEELFQHNRESSLSLLTSEKDYRETLSKMTHNLSELRTTTTSKKEEEENKFNRNIVMIAYSVGIESMKQWREILHDNNNNNNNNVNPFLKYSGLSSVGDGRNLQQNSIGLLDTADMDQKFQNVMQADIVGAVEGALTSFFDNQNEENANGGVGEDTLAAGSSASVKSFVVEFTGVDFGMDSDSDCFFPQQWMCEVDLSGGGEPTVDCPYPNLPNCGVGGIPGASDLTSGSDGTDGGNVIVEGIQNVGSECLFPAIQNCVSQQGEGETVPSTPTTPTTTTTTTNTNTNTSTNTQESDNSSISEVTGGVTATTCVLNPTLPWCAGSSGSSTSGFGDSDGWVADEQSQTTTSTTTTTTNTQVNNNSNNVVTTGPLFDDDAFDDDSQPANTTPTTTTTTTNTATPPCPYENPLLCENQDIINAAEGSLESTLGNISGNAGSVTLPNPCQFPGNPLCNNQNNNNSASSSTSTNTHSKQANNNNNDLSFGTEYVDHSTEAQKILEEEKEKQNIKNGGHRLLRHK